MIEQIDVSVIISTYNRCDLLPRAIESVLAQEAGAVRFELIVVDNNSSDQTRQVVESLIGRGHGNVHYAFEGRQGLSHGRNCRNRKSPCTHHCLYRRRRSNSTQLVAPYNALSTRTLRWISSEGEKLLPHWEREPPSWLTSQDWAGPLALVDVGNESFYSDHQRVFFFPGANFSFRRRVFDRVGLFDPHYQQVKDWVSAIEDSEFILKSAARWRAGPICSRSCCRSGCASRAHDEELSAKMVLKPRSVPRHASTERNHRRRGATQEEQPRVLKLFGTPAHLYRDSLSTLGSYLAASVMRDEKRCLKTECELRQSLNYISQRYNETAGELKRSHLSEIG